jgi:hypothetical protein
MNEVTPTVFKRQNLVSCPLAFKPHSKLKVAELWSFIPISGVARFFDALGN